MAKSNSTETSDEGSKEGVNRVKRRGKGAKALSELVYSEEASKRKEAAVFLGEKEHLGEEDFGFLKRLVKDENDAVWKEASLALGKFACESVDVYDYIRALIREDHFWVQKRGIHALEEFAKYDDRGLRYINKLVTSGRKEIVEEAVKVLGKVAIENDNAFNVLTGLLRSKEEFIIQPAIFSMGILAKKRSEALEELKPFLKDDNNFIRLWTASAIGEVARFNDEALAIFRKLVDDKDVYLRRGFSNGLVRVSKNKPNEALRLIEIAVEDSDRYVRTNAAKALGSIATKNKKAFAGIKTLLSHDKGDVRRGAAEALLSVADEMQEDILPLIKGLVKDEDYYLRSVAAFASAKIAAVSSEDAVKFVKTLVEDRDEYVRRDVALALGELARTKGEDVFPYLKKLIEDRESIVRREATKSLKMLAREKVGEVLNLTPILTNDFDEGVRENAAEVLGVIAESSTKDAFECIRKLAKDESPRVREKVAKSLEIVLDLEPDLFFTRVIVLQTDGVEPEVLRLVGKFARNGEIGRLSGLYSMLMSKLNEVNMDKSLSRALETFEGVKNIKYSEEVRKLFRTFLLGIRGRNINDIAMIKFDSELIKNIHGAITYIDPRIFEALEEVPEMALRYKQIEELSDKHIYLGKMLGSIEFALENLQGENPPEIKILRQVFLNWRAVLSQTMEGLKGRANLRIELRTKKVLPLDTLTLLLGIENTGESLAENLVVEILPSPCYNIIDKTKRIEILANKRKDAAEFRIRPTENREFRVEFSVSFDDFEMKGKSIYFADRVNFIDIPSEFKYIPNPYITGGPIKPSSKEMFFGRNEVFDFISNNISSTSQKNVLILRGERRTGKTSILYRIPSVLGPDYICVFLDGQEFGRATLDYLFYRMSKLISNACSQNGVNVTLPSREAFKEDPWYVFKDQFLEKLGGVLGNRYVVILFDEFESLEHAVTNGAMDAVIFDYIRNLMQHEEKMVFIFAGLHRLEEMMQDYWGVMFNIALYWKISFLNESEARRLITEPVEDYNMLFDDLAIEKIVRVTACHPYFIQLLCRFLVNRHNVEKRNYITVQDVNEELSNVVEKARPHFNYIWALSAPYERMLLAILPEILRKKNIATLIDILKECENMEMEVTRGGISSALKALTIRDILEEVSDNTVHYRFKVDFIRMWVEKHQPLSKVLEEIREELPKE